MSGEISSEMIKYIAGVDIGNATTETALGEVDWKTKKLLRCVSGISKTTGVKGTSENIAGIIKSLKNAARNLAIGIESVHLICINEATPVIGDFAMETITETIITESTMIGHNPDTPGGLGLGKGLTISFCDLVKLPAHEPEVKNTPYVIVVPEHVDFQEAAAHINEKTDQGFQIAGAILKKDDGVLVSNRLNKKIPIVDEVGCVEKVPLGMLCAVEVASIGSCINILSNPYGIATVFNLNAEETKAITCIAAALIGTRSAVVVKTPKGDVKERRIPSGDLIIQGAEASYQVSVDLGGSEIMDTVAKAGDIKDVKGTKGTNVGGMIERVRMEMADLTQQNYQDVCIKDLLAVDTIVPREVIGNLAGEFFMEHAVGIAAMVKTSKLHMESLAKHLSELLNIPVEIGGIEGVMAVRGALTTPGTELPLVIVDIGAGSTDACLCRADGETTSVHLAGAGNMVTMLINAELGLEDILLAEDIKRYPLAKVESLYHIRHQNGSVEFFKDPLSSNFFGRTIILKPSGWKPIYTDQPMEKICKVRREAKNKVLLQNVLRSLKKISHTGSVNSFEHVVLVGGSSLDFELGNMVTEALSYHGITSGKANVRGTEGPRNAVATGLLFSRLK